MPFSDVVKIVASILASIGGAGFIIIALSSWLGKVWANRLLEADRDVHAQKLESLRADLAQRNQEVMETARAGYTKELESHRAELALKNQDALEAARAAYSIDVEKLRAQLLQINQSALESERAQYALEIEEFRASLASANTELSAEHKARRDYEYEARKRLYNECEPLLFRLAEASEGAIHRIFSLCRTARNGDLGPQRPNWLQSPGYYMASTIYNLLLPLAAFRLLQDKITFVDLTVDTRISSQYLIGKWLKMSFTEDFVLAKEAPELTYKPFEGTWEELRDTEPEIYWRQGVTLGRLDIAIEGVIKRTADGKAQCMSFGEFEKYFEDDIKTTGATFGAFVDIFLHFHPMKRPILWRILVLQAHLHTALLESFSEHGATSFITDVPGDFQRRDKAKLDWRLPGDACYEADIMEPVRVSDSYLRRRIPGILREQKPLSR